MKFMACDNQLKLKPKEVPCDAVLNAALSYWGYWVDVCAYHVYQYI